MVRYINTKPGYMYVLTTAGAEIPRVRSKFNTTEAIYKQYKYSVPEKWLLNKWVTVIEEKGVI